jgi:hypothetical protein
LRAIPPEATLSWMARWRRPLAGVWCFLPPVLLFACDGSDDGSETADLRERVDHATVVRVDASSGVVRAVVPVGRDPLLLTTASGQVWTVNWGGRDAIARGPCNESSDHCRPGEGSRHRLSRGRHLGRPGRQQAREDRRPDRRERGSSPFGTPTCVSSYGRRGRLAGCRPGIALAYSSEVAPRIGGVGSLADRPSDLIAKIGVGGGPLVPLVDGRFLWLITLGG